MIVVNMNSSFLLPDGKPYSYRLLAFNTRLKEANASSLFVKAK